MAYLSCGRCGLEIRIRAAYLLIQNCPRCLDSGAIVSPMTLSANGVIDAVGWGAVGRDERHPMAAGGELSWDDEHDA